MRIAIYGMGIAGPTLAYWLRRSGHDPVLFEKAPAVRTGGYLIDFWGLGYTITERMGILATLRANGYEMQRMRMVDRHGRESAHVDLTPMRQALQGRFISVARPNQPAGATIARALTRDGNPAKLWSSTITKAGKAAPQRQRRWR